MGYTIEAIITIFLIATTIAITSFKFKTEQSWCEYSAVRAFILVPCVLTLFSGAVLSAFLYILEKGNATAQVILFPLLVIIYVLFKMFSLYLQYDILNTK